MLTVTRQELKFLLTKEKSISLQNDLSRILEPDKFAAAGYYRVRSLYFDSLNDTDFYDKLCGTKVRKKVRLRIYGTDQDTAKLELKAKDGAFQKKISLVLNRKEAEAVAGGAYHVLLEHKEDTAKMLYVLMVQGAYRPAVMIEYRRRAFVYPAFNTRLTFDENMSVCRSSTGLFEEELPFIPVSAKDVVLEVKFSGILAGVVKKILAKYSLHSLSVGKYEMARERGYI